MIQDIEPHVFSNEYMKKKTPECEDLALIFLEKSLLAILDNGKLNFPRFADLDGYVNNISDKAQFLFEIDDKCYFRISELCIKNLPESWKYIDINDIRDMEPMWNVFAGTVGMQLDRWYTKNRFCGRCGNVLVHHKLERAMECEKCKNIVYPTISPAVIVAVTDGDRLLMSKYASGNYKKYALIAGFAEVGESIEQTVIREVKEEVGLNVKNLRYYKSQPWPFTDTMLMGFFVELDGSNEIHIQEDELSEAVWFDRSEIPLNESKLSLTNEMVEVFRNKIEF